VLFLELQSSRGNGINGREKRRAGGGRPGRGLVQAARALDELATIASAPSVASAQVGLFHARVHSLVGSMPLTAPLTILTQYSAFVASLIILLPVRSQGFPRRRARKPASPKSRLASQHQTADGAGSPRGDAFWPLRVQSWLSGGERFLGQSVIIPPNADFASVPSVAPPASILSTVARSASDRPLPMMVVVLFARNLRTPSS
jgi:hypothetical protein